jgi:hypothetical protein
MLNSKAPGSHSVSSARHREILALPSVCLTGNDLKEGQLRNGLAAQEIETEIGVDLAEVASSELRALDVGQAVNVELKFVEAGINLLCYTLTGGSHERPPRTALTVTSHKIYYVNQKM